MARRTRRGAWRAWGEGHRERSQVVRLRHRHSAEAGCRPQAEGPAGLTRTEGRELIVVLDTGGVEGLSPIDQQRRARLRILREEATDVVLPAAVLAEGVLSGNVGHDYYVRRLLDVVNVSAVDESIGYSAGAIRRAAIRGGLEPAPSGVDAIVAAEADARAGGDDVRIVTSDGGDFEVLASLGDNSARLSVLVV